MTDDVTRESTGDVEELVERLLEMAEEHGENQFGHAHTVLEAAATITAQQAEIERLRGALKSIAAHDFGFAEDRNRARDALSPSGEAGHDSGKDEG